MELNRKISLSIGLAAGIVHFVIFSLKKGIIVGGIFGIVSAIIVGGVVTIGMKAMQNNEKT